MGVYTRVSSAAAFLLGRIELENDQTMKDYGCSYFKTICEDDQLRKCMGELKKIWNYGIKTGYV